MCIDIEVKRSWLQLAQGEWVLQFLLLFKLLLDFFLYSQPCGLSSLCRGCAAVCLEQHPFNGPFSGTIQVSRYQKGKNNLDFTEARDSEWQWHQLGRMQVCT